jgi:hypothetical protein
VTGFSVVEAVGVSRIEEPDALIECGVQHRDGSLLVAIGSGREAHAADRERSLRRRDAL